MMIRRLRIEHFRGIESADMRIDRRLVALIGAGDSTKTTLMDALGLVLSPSYNPQFTDADFYNFDLTRDIVIEAVCLAPGLMEALIPRKDESHGGTEEVPGRAA